MGKGIAAASLISHTRAAYDQRRTDSPFCGEALKKAKRGHADLRPGRTLCNPGEAAAHILVSVIGISVQPCFICAGILMHFIAVGPVVREENYKGIIISTFLF